MWYDWKPGQLQRERAPSQFSAEVALANARFLATHLLPGLIRSVGAIRKKHPILTRWDSVGPSVFVKLNSLAEDAKLLLEKPGIDAVVRDLENERGAMAAWHTLHAAALFERASPGTVLRFFADSKEECPDFLVRLASIETTVEAKLLTQSAVEKEFHRRALIVNDAIWGVLKEADAAFAVHMFVSDALTWPTTEQVLNAFAELGGAIGRWQKYDGWRMKLEPMPVNNPAAYFFAPLHDRDYLRIKGRAGKASAQIRSAAAEYGSGVLVLGFEKHDAPLVRTLLAKQMKAGRLKAIGAVVLNKQDINFGLPLVTALDYLQTFRNDWGVKPIEVDIPLQVLGLEKRFVGNEDDLALPAYVHGSARSDSGQVTVWIPPDRCIQPEWLV